jgi:hypothetical protein
MNGAGGGVEYIPRNSMAQSLIVPKFQAPIAPLFS